MPQREPQVSLAFEHPTSDKNDQVKTSVLFLLIKKLSNGPAGGDGAS